MTFFDEWENRSQLSLREWAKRRKQFLQDGEIKADRLGMRLDTATTGHIVPTLSGGLTFQRDRNRPLPGTNEAPIKAIDGVAAVKPAGLNRNRPLPGMSA
ncbi:hypothetical protein ACN4EG_25185 [Alkalinema pantanalense CENA528]|uniref:hypothetical protein n=1 Tax=Alkalinema pantanalense TaxID=1620705 RepID=UPI003D6F9FA9